MNLVWYKCKWLCIITSIIVFLIPALFIYELFNIENFDQTLPDPALSFPKLNANLELPRAEVENTYEKIIKQDDYAEMSFLVPNANRIFKCPVSKCFKKAADFNENYSNWRIQPPACKSDVKMVILIKSSILRNSLRWHIRKSWAKEIVHER